MSAEESHQGSTDFYPQQNGEDYQAAISRLRTEATATSSTTKEDDREQMQLKIGRRLQCDSLGCDVQLSLFASAAFSYKYDSILNPYPSHLYDKEAGIEQLRADLNSIPRLKDLNLKDLGQRVLALLFWILEGNNFGFSLSQVKKPEEMKELSELLKQDEKYRPNFVFRVNGVKSDREWKDSLIDPSAKDEEKAKTLFAFHGSKMENFHSILSHGLQQHLNKTSLYGCGTYLSSEVSMCHNYSPAGTNQWAGSRAAGSRMNFVVCCEILDHVDVKICTDDPKRNHTADSENGKVPEKYLIVRNNELIRNRYLLVYSNRSAAPATTSTPSENATEDHPGRRNSHGNRQPNAFSQFITRNGSALIFAGYIILLVSVGLANSQMFQRWIRRIFK